MDSVGGFEGAAANAATLGDVANIKSAADAGKLREKFNDVIGGNKKAKDSFKFTAEQLAAKGYDTQIGDAQGYDNIVNKGYDSKDKDGNTVHHDADPDAFKIGAKMSTMGQGAAPKAKLEAKRSDALKNNEELKTKLDNAVDQKMTNDSDRISNEMLARAKELNNESLKSFAPAKGFEGNAEEYEQSLKDKMTGNNVGGNVSNASSTLAMINANTAQKDFAKWKEVSNKNTEQAMIDTKMNERLDKAIAQNQKALQKNETDSLINEQRINSMQSADFLGSAVETMASTEAMQFSQMSANVASAKNLGILNESGNVTALGTSFHEYGASARMGTMMGEMNAFSNKSNQQNMINDLLAGGASKEQVQSLRMAVGNPALFKSIMESNFGSVKWNAQVNGRRIAKSMSANGGAFEGGMFKGEHYAINTQTTMKLGYDGSAGSGFTAIAAHEGKENGIDGVERSIKNQLVAAAVLETAQKTIDTILDFTSVGRAGKIVKGIRGFKGDQGSKVGGGTGSGFKGDG